MSHQPSISHKQECVFPLVKATLTRYIGASPPWRISSLRVPPSTS